MPQPYLKIFAGCNGSGKSTYSKSYVDDSIIPYDYDNKFMEFYSSMKDSELRQEISKSLTIADFKNSINKAFSKKNNFCYETNFDSNPIYWVKIAKTFGYKAELHFLCLESIELAKKRVDQRVRNNGHFVHNKVIEYKWKEGYKNLNKYFDNFDFVLFADNSNNGPIQDLFAFYKNGDNTYNLEKYSDIMPTYMERRCPDIYRLYVDLSRKLT